MKNVTFIGIECRIEKHQYREMGRMALELVAAKTDEESGVFAGERVCSATVNVPEAVLLDGEILIKDWSENKGILEVLVNAGIVKDTGKTVPVGAFGCKANVVTYLGE
jgi:hypothetical protein